jgi:hypothetical protein
MFPAEHLFNDEEAKQRFLRGAKAATALDHPDVCTVYEIGEADGKTLISESSRRESGTMRWLTVTRCTGSSRTRLRRERAAQGPDRADCGSSLPKLSVDTPVVLYR